MESISPGSSTWELQRKSICTHITSLKTYHNFLFIAEGNQILLFDWKEKTFLEKKTVFKSSSIHGIRIGDNNKVIFFGAKSIQIYTFQLPGRKSYLSEVSEEIYFDDWIHDAQWVIENQKVGNKFITISAHNSVTLWDVEKDEKETFQCSENCILYTASFFSYDTKAIVIAVGTVFKKILLWSPNCLNNINNRKLPFQSLSGHQGVIFSVTYSKLQKLICSTSDDRSIRLWKVLNDNTCDSDVLEFWETASIQSTHVLYAHESRVWMSAILNNCILSVGEDSHLCFWSLTGDLLNKKKCNKGGSIWCLETAMNPSSDDQTSGQYIAFTGGSDGGVYMWNVENALSAVQISQVSLCSSESTADFPRVTSLLTNQFADNLFVTTDKGLIYLYNIKQKVWEDIFHDKSFASYCVPSVSNKSVYLALGNIFGELVLLNFSEYLSGKSAVKKFAIHESKICSVHWVNKSNDHLLTCGIKGQMMLWKITYENQTFEIQNIRKFHLPKCKHHWWSTAALYITHANYIIVGDRGGTISLYSCQNDDSNYSELINPLMSHRYIHGENGVTDIQEHKSLIYSAGRDGKVQLYSIYNGNLNLLYTIKVSHDLEWIGKMLFCGNDLLLLGFHTKDFIVWSTMLESAVMTVECGGGHRSWDFCLAEDGCATFVAIKKKDVIFCQENLQYVLKESILKPGISGQEFCHSTYLFSKHLNSGDSMSVVACGGEDNALRIIGFLDNPGQESQIVPICSLSGHLSSIRSINKVKMKHKNVYLLVSVGGRSQMMIWKIKDDTYVQCEQLATYILSDLNKSNRHFKESRNIQMSPQTRIMDVAICLSETNETSEHYTISTACSDSFFRVYLFNPKSRDLCLGYNFHHGENCILKLAEILVKDSLKNMFFATGSTDGYVKIFNNEMCRTLPSDTNQDGSILIKNVLPLLQMKVHQSGINALDAKPVSETTWIISSAGDDNALSVTLVNFVNLEVEHSKLEAIFKYNVSHAHASQITGLKIFDKNSIVTASIDQRINIWSWNLANNYLTVKLEISIMSLIPDIAHLEVWQNEISNLWTLLICGQGIEYLNLSKHETNKRTVL